MQAGLQTNLQLVTAHYVNLAVAAQEDHQIIVVPKCQTVISYMEPLCCFHFKPHPQYDTGIFKDRSKVLFDMNRFTLKLKWCKDLGRRLFNIRQFWTNESILMDGGDNVDAAAMNPCPTPPRVIQEKIEPRFFAGAVLDDGAQNLYSWYPKLEVVGIRRARLHTRWIIPKGDVERPLGWKFPMSDQRTFKIGRVTLVDGQPQKVEFKELYFHRRPHLLVFHAKPAYDSEELYDNQGNVL